MVSLFYAGFPRGLYVNNESQHRPEHSAGQNIAEKMMIGDYESERQQTQQAEVNGAIARVII